jgi:hypothetical protein
MKDELLYRTFHQVGAVVIGPIHNSFEGLVAEWDHHHHRFKFFRKLNKTIGKFASFLNANWNGRTRGALNSVLREILPKICIIVCKKTNKFTFSVAAGLKQTTPSTKAPSRANNKV